MEYLSLESAATFAQEFSDHIPLAEELSSLIIESTTSETEQQTDLLPILRQFVSPEEFEAVE